MEVQEIPQDNASTYKGFKRVVYATDKDQYGDGGENPGYGYNIPERIG